MTAKAASAEPFDGFTPGHADEMADVVSGAGPYPGLRPFRVGERLFGRDSETNIIVDRILSNRLTLLFAAAGVGKSSLLNAGVIPRLQDTTRHNLTVAYHNRWVTDASADLRETLIRTLKSRPSLKQTALPDDLPLSSLVTLAASLVRAPLVLILDQFEEFFRYRQAHPDFIEFVRSITEVITDPDVPVALVIAMREDFAMDLNALKPGLPGRLFDNFYRLEPLTEAASADAIGEPAAMYGFAFEQRTSPEGTPESLVDVLIHDLSRRISGGIYVNPVAARVRAVEPPYLQIVCERLWQLDGRNPDRVLRFTSYQRAGGAIGILKSYIEEKLGTLTRAEKVTASKAFGHLVGRSGTKNAATASALAREMRANPAQVEALLVKLESARILRSRGQAPGAGDRAELWYELYHDAFSEHVDRWNEVFRARERRRQAVFATLAVLAVCFGAVVLYDAINNLTSRHFRMSEDSTATAVLELYVGKAGSLDLLDLQQYVQQTPYTRSRLDPDWIQARTPIGGAELDAELTRMVQLPDRVQANAEMGRVSEALSLAVTFAHSSRTDNVAAAITSVGKIRTKGATRQLERWLNERGAEQADLLLASVAHQQHPRLLGLLLSVAQSDSPPALRDSALRALAAYGPRAEVLDAFNAALQSSSDSMQLAALDGLDGISMDNNRPLAGLDTLVASMSPRTDVYDKALDLVGKKQLTRMVPTIAKRIQDGDARFSLTLARLGGQQALDALTASIAGSNSNAYEVLQAISQLRYRPDESVLDATATTLRIESLLAEPEGARFRIPATLALARMRAPGALPRLIRWGAELLPYSVECQSLWLTIERLAQPRDIESSLFQPNLCLGSNAGGITLAIANRTGEGHQLAERHLVDESIVYDRIKMLEALKRLSRSPDPALRARAARRLRRVGSAALGPLLELAADAVFDVRTAAMLSIAALEVPNARVVLGNLPNRRLSAVLMALRNEPGAATALREQMRRQTSAIDTEMAWAAAEIGSPWAVDYLSEALNVVAMSPSLNSVGRERLAVYYLRLLGSTAASAVPAVVPFLHDSRAPLRDEAFSALRSIGGDSAIAPLTELLTSPDTSQRVRAAEALLGMNESNAAAKVAERLRVETSMEARQDILRMILNPSSASPEVVEAVEELLTDKQLQGLALDVLHRLQSTNSTAAIEPLLESPGVRSQAATILADLGSRAGLDRLLTDAAVERQLSPGRFFAYDDLSASAALERLGAYEWVPEQAAAIGKSDIRIVSASQLVLPILAAGQESLPQSALLVEFGYAAARPAFRAQLAALLRQHYANIHSSTDDAHFVLEPYLTKAFVDDTVDTLGQLLTEAYRDLMRNQVAWGLSSTAELERAADRGFPDPSAAEAWRRCVNLCGGLGRIGTKRARDVLAAWLEEPYTATLVARHLARFSLDGPLKVHVSAILDAERRRPTAGDDIMLAAGRLGLNTARGPSSPQRGDAAALAWNEPGADARWSQIVRRQVGRSGELVEALRNAPHDQHTEALLRAQLQSADSAWRARAAWVAGNAGYDDVAPELARLLQDPVSSVRDAAFHALIALGEKVGFDAAVSLVRESSYLPLRIQAINALPRWAELDDDFVQPAWEALDVAASADERVLGFRAYIALSKLLDSGAAPDHSLDKLVRRLQAHRERYAAYRMRSNRQGSVPEDAEAREAQAEQLKERAPFSGLTHELVFLLSKLDPRRAETEFLRDDLLEIRNAAITYLVSRADIAALRRLDQQRMQEDDAILRGAAYRAIDLRLQAFEVIGTAEHLQQLRIWLAETLDEVVIQRIEWTIEAIEDRLRLGNVND